MKYKVSVLVDLNNSDLESIVDKMSEDVMAIHQGQIFYHLPGMVKEPDKWVRNNIRVFLMKLLTLRIDENEIVDLTGDYDQKLAECSEVLLSDLDSNIRDLYVKHIRSILIFLTEHVIRRPYKYALNNINKCESDFTWLRRNWSVLITPQFQCRLEFFLED